VVKTHRRYRAKYENAIFLHRNPREVLPSYYHFLREGKRREVGLFSDFIRHPFYGLPEWRRHTLSWIDKAQCTISFAELKASPIKVLRRIIDFIGVTASEAILEESIKLSSFGEMKRLEKKYGDKNITGATNEYSFVRKGGLDYSHYWKLAGDKKYYEEQVGHLAKKLGYSL
jgi:hypothetical protein